MALGDANNDLEMLRFAGLQCLLWEMAMLLSRKSQTSSP